MFAFSFCLYGPHTPKYHGGMLENLKIIQQHFPEWAVYIYLGSDITALFASRLLQYPQVRLRHAGSTGPILMMHRFLAISEPGIDGMMVRDADSRIHMRDRWAIHEFIRSKYGAHAIRDHPYHRTTLLGGLWGIKKGIAPMGELVAPYLNQPWAFGKDQSFLSETVYPKIAHTLLVHTSQTHIRYSDDEVHETFPWNWSETQYCGKAENLPDILGFFRR